MTIREFHYLNTESYSSLRLSDEITTGYQHKGGKIVNNNLTQIKKPGRGTIA